MLTLEKHRFGCKILYIFQEMLMASITKCHIESMSINLSLSRYRLTNMHAIHTDK